MSDLSELIRRAIKFSNWAAGEGICPQLTSEEENPDEFLSAYFSATDDFDCETLADRVAAKIEAMEAALTHPVQSSQTPPAQAPEQQ